MTALTARPPEPVPLGTALPVPEPPLPGLVLFRPRLFGSLEKTALIAPCALLAWSLPSVAEPAPTLMTETPPLMPPTSPPLPEMMRE